MADAEVLLFGACSHMDRARCLCLASTTYHRGVLGCCQSLDISAQSSRDDHALFAVEPVAEPLDSRLRSPARSIARKYCGERDRRAGAPGSYRCCPGASAGNRLPGSDVLYHAGANVECDSDRK